MGDKPLVAAWKLGSCAAHCTGGAFGNGAQAWPVFRGQTSSHTAKVNSMHLAPFPWFTHASGAGICIWDASSMAPGGISKKRKYFIWTLPNFVNSRNCNSCITVYKSNLFLNSLISDKEQGLKVISLPAKVLHAFSPSVESTGGK